MTWLVAIGFLAEDTAADAARYLRRKVPDVALDADAVAVVSRDEGGTVHVVTSHQGVVLGTVRGVFWPPLLALLCLAPLHGTGPGGGPSPLLREISESGVVDALREPVLDMLQLGTSVLFLAIGPAVPSSAVADTVRHFGGTAVTAQLPAGAELRILRALYQPARDGTAVRPCNGTPIADLYR